MRHAVIMAGGPGSRLWPLSRADRPKQLLRLFDKQSLLRASYERLVPLFPTESIYVIAGEGHLAAIAKELPELPSVNLLGEPEGRDTANAIGLAAAILHQRDPDGVMGIFTADHVIRPVDRFQAAVRSAFAVAEAYPDYLVTLGVRPTSPQTAYGYIERGEQRAKGVFQVLRFAEKPSLIDAKRFLADQRYYWNSGMFVWKTGTILGLLERFLPESHRSLTEIARVWDTASGGAKARELYPGLRKISIDFAVMERAENILMVEMDCEWADVGSWPALEFVIAPDAAANVNAASKVLHLGSQGNIVVCEDDKHLTATIGVQDLVIVHAGDATLICGKKDAQSLKELVGRIRNEFGDTYL